MKLTKLPYDERLHSCLNCVHHYKAKNGVGLSSKSTHMCAYGRAVERVSHKNQNGHERQAKTICSAATTCELVTKGLGRCRNFTAKKKSF